MNVVHSQGLYSGGSNSESMGNIFTTT